MIQFLIFYPMGMFLMFLYCILSDDTERDLDPDEGWLLVLSIIFWPVMFPIFIGWDACSYAYQKRWYERVRDLFK